MSEFVCDCNVIHAEAVKGVKEQMPADGVLYDLSDFFKVLGDSTRMKLLFALDLHELCVCDLAAVLDMTKSAVSHQLNSLRTAKLIRYRKEGKNVYYSLADDHVKDIVEKAMEHINE